MHTYDNGTFFVDSSGEVDVDYLFDGGWFRGELALFSLEGMDEFTPGSTEFMLEAARRALTNSEQGRVVVRDEVEGARFGADLPWERNFNSDPQQYLGAQTYNMTPGDEVGLMMVQHTTVRETFNNPENIFQFGKLPIFSIPEANLSATAGDRSEFVDIDGKGTIGLEDVPASGRGGDYNDMVLQFVGLDGNFAPFEDNVTLSQDWTTTEVGLELLEYAGTRVFNNGVLEVGMSGELNIDLIFDANFEGELGIFDLSGMKAKDVSSEAFVEEAISRVQSDSTEGRIILEADLNIEAEDRGGETFQMQPGALLGLIAVADGTFEDSLNADELLLSQNAFLSIPQANQGDDTQFSAINASRNGVIVGFEDENINSSEDRDYNDILIFIKGVTETVGLGTSTIEEGDFSEESGIEALTIDDNLLPNPI